MLSRSSNTSRSRDSGAYFQLGGGGLENERRRRKFVGGPGGILPQKMLKTRGSKMVFSAFSMRYFFKKTNLDKLKNDRYF